MSRRDWLAIPALSLTLALAPALSSPASARMVADPDFAPGASVPWATAKTGAAPYRSKTFKLPTGTIRVVEFKKSSQAVPYPLTSENELYIVSGTVAVGVDGKTETLVAGDAVNLPTGTLLARSDAAQDTTMILFTAPNTSNAPVGGVVPAAAAKLVSPPPGPANNGVPAAAITVKTYPFDGNSIRVIHLKSPGATAVATHDKDSLLYLLSGTMRSTVGGKSKLVRAGDAVREPAGVPSFWDVLEDSVFVSTSGLPTPGSAK